MIPCVYDPLLNLEHIVIVGAGGTGAQVARSVARILYDARIRRIRIPHLTIIDPDTVQPQNIGRQLFTAAHHGLPKARVIAQRLSLALGLDIRSIVAPFSSDVMPMRYGSQTILISCVDNHDARNAINATDVAVLIDTGNHHNAGQCIIGSQKSDHATFYHFDTQQTFRYLPHPYRVFPQLLEPEPEAETSALSCAQLVEQSSQHLLINDLMCTSAASYVYKLIHRQPITHWITFIDIDELTVKSIPVSAQSIQHYGRLTLPKAA